MSQDFKAANFADPSIAHPPAPDYREGKLILFGPSVLHQVGLTSQIPAQPCVVMLGEGKPEHRDGLYIFYRSTAWFDFVRQEIRKSGTGELADMGSFGFDYLSPRMSLVESLVAQDCWQPDRDDLDADEDAIRDIKTFADSLGEPFAKAVQDIFSTTRDIKLRRI